MLRDIDTGKEPKGGAEHSPNQLTVARNQPVDLHESRLRRWNNVKGVKDFYLNDCRVCAIFSRQPQETDTELGGVLADARGA